MVNRKKLIIAFASFFLSTSHPVYQFSLPKLLLYLAKSTNEKTALIAQELLQELSYFALRSLIGEQEIIEDEPAKQPTFDQLLGALMKVPPPKKESK